MNQQIAKEVEMLHSQVCLALDDPKRLLILYALSHQRRYVSELAEELNCPQPTISRHLKILRERGLVNTEREGTSVYYSLADERIIQALDLMRGMLRERMVHQADLAEFRALNDTQTPNT